MSQGYINDWSVVKIRELHRGTINFDEGCETFNIHYFSLKFYFKKCQNKENISY